MHGNPKVIEGACFEISDVLVCAQASQNPRKLFSLVFPTFDPAHRNPIIPEFLFRFPTFCSAHRRPRMLESAFVEISDVVFCAQESKNSGKCMF